MPNHNTGEFPEKVMVVQSEYKEARREQTEAYTQPQWARESFLEEVMFMFYRQG